MRALRSAPRGVVCRGEDSEVYCSDKDSNVSVQSTYRREISIAMQARGYESESERAGVMFDVRQHRKCSSNDSGLGSDHWEDVWDGGYNVRTSDPPPKH